MWYGISFWLIRVSCPGCLPSQDLAHSHPLWWGEGMSEGHCWSVIRTCSATNAKHSAERAVNVTSVRPNALPKSDNCDSPTLAGRVSWTTSFSGVRTRSYWPWMTSSSSTQSYIERWVLIIMKGIWWDTLEQICCVIFSYSWSSGRVISLLHVMFPRTLENFPYAECFWVSD